MRRKIVAGVAGLMLTVSVQASPVSCEDLTDMADVLDEVAEAVASLDGDIEVDGYLDNQLGELTAEIMNIANIEGDSGLSRNANRMARAWENEDADSFVDALDNVIDAMDRLYYRDCE